MQLTDRQLAKETSSTDIPQPPGGEWSSPLGARLEDRTCGLQGWMVGWKVPWLLGPCEDCYCIYNGGSRYRLWGDRWCLSVRQLPSRLATCSSDAVFEPRCEACCLVKAWGRLLPGRSILQTGAASAEGWRRSLGSCDGSYASLS